MCGITWLVSCSRGVVSRGWCAVHMVWCHMVSMVFTWCGGNGGGGREIYFVHKIVVHNLRLHNE